VKYCSTAERRDILRPGGAPVNSPDLLTQIFGFLSTTARYVGQGIVTLVQYILPSVKDLSTLAEPIGFLSLLTVFVILASAARKVALILLLVGWALIFIRLLLMAFRIG
jgi:hypothetical protein